MKQNCSVGSAEWFGRRVILGGSQVGLDAQHGLVFAESFVFLFLYGPLFILIFVVKMIDLALFDWVRILLSLFPPISADALVLFSFYFSQRHSFTVD